MKFIKVRDEWKDAQYELVLMEGDAIRREHFPFRFNVAPSQEDFADAEKARAWIAEHRITPCEIIGV